jgi:5-methyltetrahydropteroyltriglutamate--homocysteine methyltransferase
VEAGLDVITDGEQSRLDFNLSFYGYLQGIEADERPLARLSVRPRTTSAASTPS